MRLGKKSLLYVEPLEDRCLPSADFVFDWNATILDVQRLRGQGSPPAARALAILDAAIYDSVNAISPTHTVFHVDARTFRTHNQDGQGNRARAGPRPAGSYRYHRW
jgi:hypothetical protein